MAKPFKPATTTVAPEPAKPAPTSFKSFAVARAPGGWTMITTTLSIDSEGNMAVTDVHHTDVNSKVLTQEAFKVAVGNYWRTL